MINHKMTQFMLLLAAGALFSACGAKDQIAEQQPTVKVDTETQTTPKKRDLTGLDVLTDYDRDLWTGPEGWSDEQWKWKRQLGWDRECDYVGSVDAIDLGNQKQLIVVQCVPGAYQPMSYLYLFDSGQEKSKPLNLGLLESSEKLQDVFGTIDYNKNKKELSILTLSRGLGDCGTYRIFELSDAQSFDQTTFVLEETRQRDCENYGGKNFEDLPKEIFNFEDWPIVR